MIYFTGDINITDTIRDFGFGVGSKIKEGYDPFLKIPKDSKDIWIGNFEGVISESPVKKGIFEKMMRIEPGYFKNGLIDFFGIANNHVMEHGPVAYNEMISQLRKICQGVFGMYDKKSITFLHDNKNIGVTGISFRIESHVQKPLYWNNPMDNEIKEEVEKLSNCDIKIAYVHWGVEYVTYPSMDQRRLAHNMIDMGYDLIIGMHPHVLQGYEIYDGKYIFYSLGNFVFNYPWLLGTYGAVVALNPVTMELKYHYVKIDNNLQPVIINEEEVPDYLQFKHLNHMIGKDMDIEKYVSNHYRALSKYRKCNRRYIAKNIFKHNISDIFNLGLDFIKRKI